MLPSYSIGQPPANRSSSAVNAECIEDLPIPSYSVLAWSARATGIVSASVKLGQDASVVRLDVEEAGGPRILTELVKGALRSARFSSLCKGRTIRFHFLYRLNGEDADSMPQPVVRYKGGTSFEIVTRPPHIFLDESQPSINNAQ